MIIECVRRIQFCAGHRVNKHESKCRNLHGHNYVAWFTAQPRRVTASDPGLDPLGRIIDFSVLKERLGGWLDANWDHGFILDAADSEAVQAVRQIPEQKLFLMPYNPTAENMARFLLNAVAPSLFSDSNIIITMVKVDETENCSATATLQME